MYIHIVGAHSFINQFYKNIEKAYPGQNIFLVKTRGRLEDLKYIDSGLERVYPFDIKRRDTVKMALEICPDSVKAIVVHYLSPDKAFLANRLKKIFGAPTYWVFYGSDLYMELARLGKMNLYDKGGVNKYSLKRILYLINFLQKRKSPASVEYRHFIRELDYFCFWNKYDYELLKNSFESDARLKYFRYFAKDFSTIDYRCQYKGVDVLVGNSAAKTNNHFYAFNLLSNKLVLDNINRVIVPLSYGDELHRDKILEYGKRNFRDKFYPIVDFMKPKAYFEVLSNVSVAFFPSLRPQAGNNIYYLLASGARLFLRKGNTILDHMQDFGYFVHDMDINCGDEKIIKPLSIQERRRNNQLVKEEYTPGTKDQVYSSLFK